MAERQETEEEKREREDRERRREWLLLLLALLVSNARQDIAGWITQAGAKTITPQELGDRTVTLLLAGHAHAAYIGRNAAGLLSPFGQDDQAFGQSVTLEQQLYLAGFVQDLTNGRYTKTVDGEEVFDEGAAQRRGQMYADRIAGTANEAWLRSIDQDTMVTWDDVGDSRECTAEEAAKYGFPHNCPDLAEASPWRAGDLDASPGSGSTPCLTACRCRVWDENGEEVSFDLARVLD